MPTTGLREVHSHGTHEDESTVLYKTKSLDDINPNTNPKTKTKTNPNRNTDLDPNPKLTQILTYSVVLCFFEHRPLIFSLAHFNLRSQRPDLNCL